MADGVAASTGGDRVERAVALARAIVGAARQEQVTFLAAAVAYYAFVSLVPLALLTFAVTSALGGEMLTGVVRDIAADLLAPSGEEVLFEALEGQEGRGGVTVASLLVLTWGALRVFRGLDSAFARVYGASEAKSLLEQVREALVVLGAVGVGLIGMAVAGAAVALLPTVPAVRGAGVVALWLTLVVAFLPLYYFFPDVRVTVREALPGAALAAGVFTTLGTLFGAYTAVAGDYAVYGVLGGVLLLVTYLYVGSTAVLVGAVLNAVLAGHVGN